MITYIKRSDDDSGIGGSFSELDDMFGYSANDVEKESGIEVVRNNELTSLLEKFESSLHARINGEIGIDEVLTPSEINYFVSKTHIYRGYTSYNIQLSPFLTRLIQNSYIKGYNDFYLNFNGIDSPYNFMRGIDCTDEKNPIKMIIEGEVGPHFGEYSSNISAKINGDCGYLLGNGSYNLDVSVFGDVGARLASGSMNFKGVVTGNVSYESFMNAENGTILIEGDVGSNFCRDAKRIYAEVKGNVGELFGYSSKEISMVIGGKCDHAFGHHAKNLDVTIKEFEISPRFCPGTKNSQIKTRSKKMVANILKYMGNCRKYSSVFSGINSKNSIFSDDELWQKYLCEVSDKTLDQSYNNSVIFINDSGIDKEVIRFI
jgi:formylmethanofuran dehydrogenase subunit C